MNRQRWIVTLVLLLTFAMTPFVVGAENDAKTEAWARAMKPGEPHAGLADQAGEWRYVVSFWDEAGGEPTKLEGASTKTLIMGGRFLQEELTGEFDERPFKGLGITGYDNVAREYVAIWLDNMGTGIQYYSGQQDAKGVQTFASTVHDPVSGKASRMRSLGRVVDRDHHTFESYMKKADGTDQLHMRVEYTRAAAD